MAAGTEPYSTLSLVLARLALSGQPDTERDARLLEDIRAASRWIDEYCGRRFHTTTADETRYYTAEFYDLLFLPDDLVSVTTLSTDEDGDRVYETTWATTDYDLLPDNETPKTRIEVTPNGVNAFPVGVRRGVKIVGKFGYSQTPDLVTRACTLQAIRLFKRDSAPFGLVSGQEIGQAIPVTPLDPDVALMLAPLRRTHVGAA